MDFIVDLLFKLPYSIRKYIYPVFCVLFWGVVLSVATLGLVGLAYVYYDQPRLVTNERIDIQGLDHLYMVKAEWKPRGFCSYKYTSVGIGDPYPDWVYQYKGPVTIRRETLLETCWFQAAKYSLLTQADSSLAPYPRQSVDASCKGDCDAGETGEKMRVAREQLVSAGIRLKGRERAW